MAKKRGNNEGSITRRPDGRWMAQVTLGRDPATGKPRRATFYGKTRQDVADKLTKALRDKQQGTFVAPHKLTWGNGWTRGCGSIKSHECGLLPSTPMKGWYDVI
jgi:integrase